MRILAALLIVAIGLSFAQRPAVAGKYNDWENWMSSGTAVLPNPSNASHSRFRTIIGGGAAIAPEYLGTDDLELKPLPLLDTTYAGKLFVSTQQGVGYNLWRTRTVRAGPRLTFDFGRDSGDHANLTGLPDVDFGTEIGLFVEAYNGPWRLRGDVRKEFFGGHDGLLGNVDVAWGSRWTDSVSLVLGGRATVMGEKYAQAYFSVPAANAISGRPAYEAGASIRDFGGYVQVIYDINRSIFISAEGRGNFLFGDAADSPLSTADTTFIGSVMAGVRF